MTEQKENPTGGKSRRGGTAADFMRRRKVSRMLAMQYLFMADIQDCWETLGWAEIGAFRYLAENAYSDDADIDDAVSQEDLDVAWTYANVLIGGVLQIRSELDALITRAVANWELNRISYVDRAVLRLAAFEIYKKPNNVTAATAINEAVELAKKFSTREAQRFVNGVLDKVKTLVENDALKADNAEAEAEAEVEAVQPQNVDANPGDEA